MSSGIKIEDVNLFLPVVSKVNAGQSKGISPVGGEIVKKNGKHYVHALRNVNLEIKPGDRVGLIGHNGAGKTTLMRMMCGIFQPTQGRCRVQGRVSTLFSSTIGMDNNATGLENIRFALTLYGVPRHDLHKYIDDIAEFSELGDYLNFPIRTYSAGMRTRLGFSIVTSIEPDILIIDEVLTTGDKEFAQKAKERIIEFAERANILIVASHSPALLSLFCTRGIWMHRGGIQSDGDFYKIIEAYSSGRHSDASIENAADADIERMQDPKTSRAPIEVPSVVTLENRGKTVVLHTAGQVHYANHASKQIFYEHHFLGYTRALGLSGTYVDIGANIGSHSVYWGLFSKADSIVGFELLSKYYDVACQNVQANNLSKKVNIQFHAVGAEDGEQEIYFDAEQEIVQILTLDSLVCLHDVSLIKIDIEGMEPEALAGMKKILKRDRPIVFCKFIQDQGDTRIHAEDLILLMESLDYQWTGRAFNYTPTLEFWPRSGPMNSKLTKLVREWDLDPSGFLPSNLTGFVQPEGKNSAIFHLDASPKIFFVECLEEFSKPSLEASLSFDDADKDGEFFLEIDASPVGNVAFSVIVNQYDETQLLKQDRVFCNRRKVQPINLVTSMKQVRIIFEAKGSGFIDIRRLVMTQVIPQKTTHK